MTPTMILSEVSYSFTFNSQHCDLKMQQTLKLSIQFQINDEKISIILINKKQLKQGPFKWNPPFFSLQAITASAVSKGVTKPSHME